jgi:hypothetical protein
MITINTSPTGTPSVHDAMWHVCSSDNSGSTDMKFVFDVWINGVQKIRVKQVPEPVTGKAYFDAGPIIRNSMTFAWFEPINSSAYVAEPDMSGQAGIVYALRVGEDVSGVTTSNMASGEVSGFNWAAPLFKRRVITLTDKLNKWLTNRPATLNTGDGENLFIGFYTNATLTLKVDKFDFSNTQIGSTLSGSPTVIESGFAQMNIGTTALSATLSTTFANVKYYDVWFNSLDKVRVYIRCNPKYTCIPIHFLNRWGVFDTQRFDLVSKLSMEVERKGFGQRDYQFNGNSVDYKSTANRYYEGRINYFNSAKWTYKLTADAMTDEEYEWIADLMTSPQILMEVDGYFYPVTIKGNNYEYSKFVNNKLKALDLEFELNTTRQTQLR